VKAIIHVQTRNNWYVQVLYTGINWTKKLKPVLHGKATSELRGVTQFYLQPNISEYNRL